jgi:acetyl/propionyl-CoA carboxylase alpha subunit
VSTSLELRAAFAGTVVRVAVAPGDHVGTGATLLVLEAMKMEHVVEATTPGRIDSVAVGPGDAVQTGDVLVTIVEVDHVPGRADDVATDAAAPAPHRAGRGARPRP